MMLTKAMLKWCYKFLMQNVTTCICRCCQIGLCPTQSPDLFGMSSAYLTASSFIVTDQQPTMHCNMGDTTDQNTSNTPFSNLIVHKQVCVCVCTISEAILCRLGRFPPLLRSCCSHYNQCSTMLPPLQADVHQGVSPILFHYCYCRRSLCCWEYMWTFTHVMSKM